MTERTENKGISNAIVAKNVTFKFGGLVALDNISFRAPEGKVTGLLGPNGAGKTTLIKTMTTLLKPCEGTIEVDGINVLEDPKEIREHIGLAGQFAAVDDFLTGRETLEMVARLYGLSNAEAKRRSQEMLVRLGLEKAANRQAKTYSGGMKRRLDLGASLVATPRVLFLDEPTTGLDPRTRMQLWDIIRDLVKQGVTILLTTQYLEEADALCDEIYVMDKGKMVINGTSEELKSSLGQDIIELKIDERNISTIQTALEKSLKCKVEVNELTRRLKLRTKNGAEDVLKVANILKDNKVKAQSLSLHKPSLDDVFLTITGGGKK